ncbi:MAG: MFS transporter [Hyphomicrobiaceae bacterium]|nr:MFS transporter [Hyphomicrobiaceae bacterium]
MHTASQAADSQISQPIPTRRAPLRALFGWVLYDWAAQPYYTLVLTFLFAPYFATVVVGDAARGQALWGYAAATAGILVAIGSPLLGALADGRGRRKPWIALLTVVLVAGLATLWLAVPAASNGTIALILAAFILATLAAEFTQVFTNAIMPTLVPYDQLGRLSGTGWAVGYAGGLVSLAFMAGLIVADPTTGKTVIGLDPLLRLDTASREGDRLVGPLAAVWFLLFMLPFFLFVPDRPPPQAHGAAPRRTAMAELWDTIKGLPSHPDMLYFLVARMLYTDGLAAIFAFGGIYGAAVFGWGALELGLFGIVLTATGVIGAIAGGVLDDRIGARTVIIGALFVLLIGALGILSIDRTHVLFTLDVAPKAPGSSPFSSTGERVFLAFAMVIGIVAAPVQAASRSLLARLAPPDKITQFFGLFAFSGKVTAFMAPFMVATVTAASGSQRIGMSAIAVFLVVGIALMAKVHPRAARDDSSHIIRNSDR